LKRELDALITQMYGAGISYADSVRQFKKRYILEVLAHHKGNQCKAAIELGMHRNTLSRTLAELDLDTAQIRKGMRRPEVAHDGCKWPVGVEPQQTEIDCAGDKAGCPIGETVRAGYVLLRGLAVGASKIAVDDPPQTSSRFD